MTNQKVVVALDPRWTERSRRFVNVKITSENVEKAVGEFVRALEVPL